MRNVAVHNFSVGVAVLNPARAKVIQRGGRSSKIPITPAYSACVPSVASHAPLSEEFVVGEYTRSVGTQTKPDGKGAEEAIVDMRPLKKRRRELQWSRRPLRSLSE